jgi:hypothetical protein
MATVQPSIGKKIIELIHRQKKTVVIIVKRQTGLLIKVAGNVGKI